MWSEQWQGAERAQAARLAAELLTAERTNGEILCCALRSLMGKPEGNKHIPAAEELTAKPPHALLPSAPVSKPKPSVITAEPVGALLSDRLSTSEQKVLDALASLEAVGVEAPSKTQLAAFAGYSNPKSGGFAGPAAALMRKGLVESNGGSASMTSSGRMPPTNPAGPQPRRSCKLVSTRSWVKANASSWCF